MTRTKLELTDAVIAMSAEFATLADKFIGLQEDCERRLQAAEQRAVAAEARAEEFARTAEQLVRGADVGLEQRVAAIEERLVGPIARKIDQLWDKSGMPLDWDAALRRRKANRAT
jgi:hypothetical protein